MMISPASSRPPHDVHDLLLGPLDILQTHRAHVLHVLLDQRGRPIGHVAEDLLLEFLARGLQRQRQFVVVHFLEHRLDALVVDQQDILEDEHQARSARPDPDLPARAPP
jgi:hypothetical protein